MRFYKERCGNSERKSENTFAIVRYVFKLELLTEPVRWRHLTDIYVTNIPSYNYYLIGDLFISLFIYAVLQACKFVY